MNFVNRFHYEIKKRLLSLTLAVLLITALAIPASAATIIGEGTYGNGSYATSGSCYTNHWSCVIELTSSTDSYENYLFQVNVTPIQLHDDGDGVPLPTVPGEASTRIASHYHRVHYTLYGISVRYLINGAQVRKDSINAN